MIVATAFAIPSASAREYCKASIQVQNNTELTIKIYKAEIYDYQAGKWRSENLKNKELPVGGFHTERANLAGVGGERMKIKITYKSLGRNGKWSSKRTGYHSVHESCLDDTIHVATIAAP